jgi:hypothetical protein
VRPRFEPAIAWLPLDHASTRGALEGCLHTDASTLDDGSPPAHRCLPAHSVAACSWWWSRHRAPPWEREVEALGRVKRPPSEPPCLHARAPPCSCLRHEPPCLCRCHEPPCPSASLLARYSEPPCPPPPCVMEGGHASLNKRERERRTTG